MLASGYESDSALNGSATQAAEQLVAQLAVSVPDAYKSAFAGTAITSTGLEISLAGPGASTIRAAVPETVNGVPVAVRIVAHSDADLQKISDKIGRDRTTWIAQGITPSSWGPDYQSNKILVYLEKYSTSAATAIENKYGKDLVAVSTESRTISAS